MSTGKFVSRQRFRLWPWSLLCAAAICTAVLWRGDRPSVRPAVVVQVGSSSEPALAPAPGGGVGGRGALTAGETSPGLRDLVMPVTPLLPAVRAWIESRGYKIHECPESEIRRISEDVARPLEVETARFGRLERDGGSEFDKISSQFSIIKLTCELAAIQNGNYIMLDYGVAEEINKEFYARFANAWAIRMAPFGAEGNRRQLLIIVDKSMHGEIADIENRWQLYNAKEKQNAKVR